MEKWLAAFILVAVVTGCAGRKTGKTLEALLADTTEVADTMGVNADELGELIDDEPMSAAVDELFDDFIFNFASNRRLQMERIVFPLTVSSDEGQKLIQRSKWKMEHFFMRQDSYTLIFDSPEQMELMKDTALSTVIVEKIFLNEHVIEQYLFERKVGRWMLAGINKQSMPRNPNAQFLSFYERFVTDSVFQHESLSEQIVFVGPDPEDDFAQMEGVITPDFWDGFRPDLPRDMIYNIVYGQQAPAALQKILVLRGIANGLEVELTFRQHRGRWKLTKMIT